MGGGQSQQFDENRIILERESFNVVHVSEDVIKRLRGGAQESSEKQNPSTDFVISSSEEETKLRSLLEEERNLTNRLGKDLGSIRSELQSTRDRAHQLEVELKSQGKSTGKADQEAYYQKLNELTKRQTELQEAMKQQFKETVANVSSKFFGQESESACAPLESDVLRCYMDNPRSTLNCSSMAKQFMNCVNEYRADMLARQA